MNFPGVTFHPWIGAKFEDSCFGIRLLILGESHYNQDLTLDDPDFTRKVVRDLGQKHQSRRSRFFTVIAKVLRGDRGDIGDDERSEIWEHVAFYNFVQSVVPHNDTPPTSRQWDEAQTPFETVLRCLRPSDVLILGRRLDKHVRHRPPNITFTTITHPRALGYADAIPTVQAMLGRARSDTRE